MSQVTKCDGPHCREITDQHLEASGWYILQRGTSAPEHFHAAACLQEYLRMRIAAQEQARATNRAARAAIRTLETWK